jgi:predicted oxidoreductase
MKTQPLGKSSLVSSRLSFGCMRIAGTWKPSEITPEMAAKGKKSVITAYEAGYTLFDHADIYCAGACETLFGQALKEVSGMRERILIGTKCGIIFAGQPSAGVASPNGPHRFDFSPQHIIWSCEQSLKRLGVEMIDLYQLHRPDYLMDPPLVAEAFDKLRQQGKVREFGVSNFTPSFVSTLQKACSFPLVVNQVEIHLGSLANFEDGTLDQCIAENITPLSWCPLGGGFLVTGKPDPAGIPKQPAKDVAKKLFKEMDQVAAAHGVSRSVLAIAWLLKHPSRIIPIVGSNTPERIREAVRADSLELSREDWYRLMVAARGEPLP